jgi:serine protease Do
MSTSTRRTRNTFISRRMGISALLLASISLAWPIHAATLDPSIMAKVQSATFEVVEAKPVSDPVIYDKPLALNLLPYQQRNDKYRPVGTAFAIGNNRYVTAGHVILTAAGDSLWGAPELRDEQGHVYAIDKIEKFSLRKDFVVFSLLHDPSPTPLQLNTKPTLNETVFAVGDALGEGVVARDGLYTSDTPEEQDGDWKWLRFSAAASPGNSGGPLLDGDGKVIGIVLRKSPNENLNIALPIGEVLSAPDNLAVIDTRVTVHFPTFDTPLTQLSKQQFALPLSFADFNATFVNVENGLADKMQKQLLAQEGDRIFPQGQGSDQLLHTAPPLLTFPEVINRGPSGQWVTGMKHGKKATLPNNAYVQSGIWSDVLFFHMGRPDNIAAASYYNDPKVMMDQLAKLGFIAETISGEGGSEKSTVISLGEPVHSVNYTDKWGRPWREDTWTMPYSNTYIVVDSLPVPDGSIMLLHVMLPASREQQSAVMRALTDFVTVSYDGSLAQWKDFMQNTQWLPTALKSVSISIDYDRNFAYRSRRIDFTFSPQLQKIVPDSRLTLSFGFLKNGDDVAMDVGDVRVKPDANTPARINIRRNVAPTDAMTDRFKTAWQKYQNSQHPYDGVMAMHDDVAEIATVVKPRTSNSQVLYSAFYGVEGNQSQDAMKSKLDMLVNGFKVNE